MSYQAEKLVGPNELMLRWLRRISWRFPTVLLLVLGAPRVWAVEVPFSSGQTIAAAYGSARSVHAADMDGDGDLDVLGAGFFDVSWWENLDGSGGSWSVHLVDDDEFRWLVRAVDMDGDGDLDFLSGYLDITWWENLDGTATSWTEHTVRDKEDSTTAWLFHAADLDGDGDFDIVGAEGYHRDITLWENLDGQGTSWSAQTISVEGDITQAFWWLTAADVDGDGDPDLLGVAQNYSYVAWFENLSGDATSWTQHTIDDTFTQGTRVHAADVDRDGDLDIVGAGYWYVTWWENVNGTGTSWTEHVVDEDVDRSESMAVADIDGDGDVDIVAAAYDGDNIRWWENSSGLGSSWVARTIVGDFNGPYAVDAGDIDGDGDLDVFGAAHDAGLVSWWRNKTIHRNAVLPFKRTIDSDFADVQSARPADVDGDGDLDVVGVAFQANTIAWWENLTGDGSSWTRRIIDSNFELAASVDAADLDGDGDLDLLGAAARADAITWWENLNGTGTDWSAHSIAADFDFALSVRAADIDGDGNLDVLGAAAIADDITWWENPGGAATSDGTPWTEHTIDGHFEAAIAVHAADVDGDGDLDVLGAGHTSDAIKWWENVNGTGTSWTDYTIDESFDGAISLGAGDIDGDGDLDVLGAANGANDITWWENVDGTGTSWSVHSVDGAFSAARSVYAADLDGDGDLDVLGAAAIADDVAWWENVDGSGTAWTKHTIDLEFDAAQSVDAADIDGDGDLDVLGAAQNAGDIAWWENRGGQFALPTASVAESQLTLPVDTAVLQIDAVHNGRAGDTDVELVTFELLFDDGIAPLTDVQANSVIETLWVYRDVPEPFSDAPVAAVSALSLNAGVQRVTFADGNPDVQIAFDTPRRYFVVLDLVSAGLVNMLRVTHLTESSSTAEDRDHDIPLKLEFAFNTSTPLMVLEDGPEAACPPDLVRANQTLTGTQELKATSTATLGSKLIVNGTDIAVNAPEVSILPETTISGVFSVGNNPSCP